MKSLIHISLAIALIGLLSQPARAALPDDVTRALRAGNIPESAVSLWVGAAHRTAESHCGRTAAIRHATPRP